MHGDGLQGKIVSETSAIVGCGLVCLLSNKVMFLNLKLGHLPMVIEVFLIVLNGFWSVKSQVGVTYVINPHL